MRDPYLTAAALPFCPRALVVFVCVQLLSLNSHNVSNWYHDLLKLLEGKEQSGRIIGLQW